MRGKTDGRVNREIWYGTMWLASFRVLARLGLTLVSFHKGCSICKVTHANWCVISTFVMVMVLDMVLGKMLVLNMVWVFFLMSIYYPRYLYFSRSSVMSIHGELKELYIFGTLIRSGHCKS
jgi:hypothetical protein